MNIGDTYTDGTAVFKVKSLKQSGLVGKVEWYAGNTTPTGYLLCDGSAISRTDYAELFGVIGTTYGTGDGSTTFNLPNLIGRFAEGAATAGTYIGAGLPNITGTAERMYAYNWGTSGALYTSRTSSVYGFAVSGTENASMFGFGINANRSNAIYGSSSTVQPPSLTLRPLIKYA